jgi:hypothetical protein
MSLYPSIIDSNTSILNVSKYNGRVDIIQEPPANILFQMQEKIALKNKATAYREALTGTWENNMLAQVFFSAGNIQILQNGIRAGVYKKSEYRFVVAPQNIDTLKVIMRSIYLQYAEHYADNITGQVERLNQLVLDYAIPSVFNEAVGYVKYCQDQSSLVVPLERAQQHDREYKQLKLKPWL